MSENSNSVQFAPSHNRERAMNPSLAVENAFDKLRDVTHEAITIEPDTELAKVVHDFGDGLVNDELIQVSMMAMIGDRLGMQLKSANAKRALGEYRKYVDDEQYEYATGILSDLPIINRYANDLITEWTNPNNEPDKGLRDALKEKNSGVERRLWNAVPGLAELDKLVSLVEDVNLESIIIKASMALQTLNDPNTSDNELLRTAFIVESTYAPLCEILGLDAFAATLLDRTYSLRLEKSGREDVLRKAREKIEQLGDPEEVRNLIATLPSLFIGESDHELVVDNSSGHETYFSMAYSEIDSEQYKGIVRVLMREKSVGSTARKIERAGRIPADIVGMTVITQDTDEVGPAFATVYERLKNMDNVAFVPAPSRDQALHIKGSQAFYDSIISQMSNQFEHEDDETKLIDGKLHNDGFEVAKFTLEWHWTDSHGVKRILPIEAQFMHALSRRESRIGIDAHTIFKYFKLNGGSIKDMTKEEIDKVVKHIVAIHDRKDTMNPRILPLIEPSKKRGEILRHDIDNIEHLTPATGITAIGGRATHAALDAHNQLHHGK